MVGIRNNVNKTQETTDRVGIISGNNVNKTQKTTGRIVIISRIHKYFCVHLIHK